jgi:hypothetical protein
MLRTVLLRLAVLLLLLLSACVSEHDATESITVTADDPVDYLSADSSNVNEPMVVEHPDGTLFVCGYGGRGGPRLYQSQDAGQSWDRVDIGTAEDGAVGNSDCDLAVGPEGTVYLTKMLHSQGVGGLGVAIAARPADENRWFWTTISEELGSDRPWVEVGPDGTAHLVWNRGQQRDSTAERGVLYTRSKDEGRTWAPPKLIYPYGASSHLAVGPNGELALRIIPHIWERRPRNFEGDFVAISLDGGDTWDLKAPPRIHNWEADAYFEEVPRWVEPLAWDDQSTLYHLWSEITSLQLARSTDQGTTWTISELVASTDTLYFPYLTARGTDEIAAVWHTGQGMDLKVQVAVARVDPHDGSILEVQQAELPYDVVGPWGRDGSDSRTPLGEYKPVVFLRDGDLAVVTPILNVREGRHGFRWHRLRLAPE